MIINQVKEQKQMAQPVTINMDIMLDILKGHQSKTFEVFVLIFRGSICTRRRFFRLWIRLKKLWSTTLTTLPTKSSLKILTAISSSNKSLGGLLSTKEKKTWSWVWRNWWPFSARNKAKTYQNNSWNNHFKTSMSTSRTLWKHI